jgi:hypothetical protein
VYSYHSWREIEPRFEPRLSHFKPALFTTSHEREGMSRAKFHKREKVE